MGAVGAKKAGGGGFFNTSGAPTAPIPQPSVTITPVNQNNPQVQSQAPNDQNTPVTPQALTNISKMTDDELAALVIASKSAMMPNFLADKDDPTQKFVFQAGLNEKPIVLDQQEFDKFKKDNNMPDGHVIARSVDSAQYMNQQGYQIIDARNNVRADILLATILVIGLIGLLLDFLIGLLEKRILRAWGGEN